MTETGVRSQESGVKRQQNLPIRYSLLPTIIVWAID